MILANTNLWVTGLLPSHSFEVNHLLMCKYFSQSAQLCKCRRFFGYLPMPMWSKKQKQNSWLTYSHMIYQKHWLPWWTNPMDPQVYTWRKKIKRRKKKVFRWFGHCGRNPCIEAWKWSFISIVYDDTPPLEKTCKVLMSLTQKWQAITGVSVNWSPPPPPLAILIMTTNGANQKDMYYFTSCFLYLLFWMW